MSSNFFVNSSPLSVEKRSVCTTSIVQRDKSSQNPEEEVLKKSAKTMRNKMLKKKKQKSTVWGIIDVYRFIDVQTLASLMKKSIGTSLSIQFVFFS